VTQDEILSLFRETNALLSGHFQLSSGLHSPQYFQCAKVLQYPAFAAKLCAEIVNHFHSSHLDAVISPAIGGIVVGQEVARQRGIRSMFTERKDRLMQLRRGFEVRRGEQILVCEDVITTGGSVGEVIAIVRDRGAIVAGVGAIVDRSGGKVQLPDFYATVTMNVVTYEPGDCPLCKEGVPIQKPGSRQKLHSPG